MTIELSFRDKKKLLKNLQTRNRAFLRDAKKEMIIGGDRFLQEIRSKWYSGRRGDDTGLNQDTRDLYRNWFSEVTDLRTIDRGEIALRLRNAMRYAKFHEFGSEKNNLPKRTFVTEDLKGELGKQLFTEVFKQLLKKNY